MELGALVCKPKKPLCGQCPLESDCGARSKGVEQRLPVKKKAAPKKTVHLRAQFSVDASGKVWVVRRPDTGLLAGLWALPMETKESVDDFTLEREPDARIKHAFTHLIWMVDVYRQAHPRQKPDPNWRGEVKAMSVKELGQVALGGPSLKALLKLGVELPKRRGSGV